MTNCISANTGPAPESRADVESDPEEHSGPSPTAVEPPVPALPAGNSVTAAGFLVLSPYLAQLGLGEWTTAHPWVNEHQFEPLTILLAWIMAFILGARSAEGTKFPPREDWGWVIGRAHYPHPDTL